MEVNNGGSDPSERKNHELKDKDITTSTTVLQKVKALFGEQHKRDGREKVFGKY